MAMAKKATVAKRAIKSGMADLLCIGHASFDKFDLCKVAVPCKAQDITICRTLTMRIAPVRFSFGAAGSFYARETQVGCADGKSLMVL
jgi:hypothetical protein